MFSISLFAGKTQVMYTPERGTQGSLKLIKTQKQTHIGKSRIKTIFLVWGETNLTWGLTTLKNK